MFKSKQPSALATLLLLLPLLTLQACASQIPTAGTSAPASAPNTPPASCTEFARISFDRLNDTLPTIAEIKAYDAARDALCGVGK